MPPGKVLLVDDRLLLSILLDDRSVALKSVMRRRPIYTTGHWYYRLCHAVRSDVFTGALSGPLQRVPAGLRQKVMQSLVRLPDDVGLVSLRDLAPTMAVLSERQRLNVLSLEALSAAVFLPAEIALSSIGDNPTLKSAAAVEQVRLHVVDPA